VIIPAANAVPSLSASIVRDSGPPLRSGTTTSSTEYTAATRTTQATRTGTLGRSCGPAPRDGAAGAGTPDAIITLTAYEDDHTVTVGP
jgi:hypothetical protein